MSQIPDLGTLIPWLLVTLVAITFHEAAHGFVAWKRGDPTAHQLGRVTFNPLKHIDPFGTVILPAMMILTGMPFTFGWAKPVPVMFSRLNNPRWDGVWVSLAGPGINFALGALAILTMVVFQAMGGLSSSWAGFVSDLCLNFLLVNLVLGVFNLLPIPPMDGYRVVSAFLPPALSKKLARIERFGLGLVLLGLFVVPWLLGKVGIAFDPLAVLLRQPVIWLMTHLTDWFGINWVG